jgi:hypothetical protein
MICVQYTVSIEFNKGWWDMTQAKTHQNELERLSALESRAEIGGGPQSHRATSPKRQINRA